MYRIKSDEKTEEGQTKAVDKQRYEKINNKKGQTKRQNEDR